MKYYNKHHFRISKDKRYSLDFDPEFNKMLEKLPRTKNIEGNKTESIGVTYERVFSEKPPKEKKFKRNMLERKAIKEQLKNTIINCYKNRYHVFLSILLL